MKRFSHLRFSHLRWMLALLLCQPILCLPMLAGADTPPPATPAALPATPTHPQLNREQKVAALLADWFKGSHPDVLLTRILQTYTRDFQSYPSKLELVSAYRDMPTDKDLTKTYATGYGFRVAPTAAAALTLGTGK